MVSGPLSVVPFSFLIGLWSVVCGPVQFQRFSILNFQLLKVAVLFERLGPYHHARLNAAGKLLDVFGIEAREMDETYAWEKVEGADSFTRLTLTERQAQGGCGRVAQASSPAGSGGVPPPASGSRTGTVPEPAAGTAALRPGSWKREVQRQLWKALDETRPQAVVVPGWSSVEALSALKWCLQTRTPIVMMSETTAWDERRSSWKEWMKQRLVGLCSAALVGGTPHKDYLLKLGMPVERVFLGYDVVDNGYFAAEAAKYLKHPSEVAAHFTGQGSQPGEVGTHRTGQGRNSEVRGPWSVVRGPFGLPDRYFLASARFVEKKNLPRLLEAYARYRTLCTDHRPQDYETTALQTTGQQTAGPQDQRSVVRGPVVGGLSQVVRSPVVPWSLVLLGDGPLKPDLCHLISDLSLQHHVLLPGFKQYDELPMYYGLASAFIHASTTEQWGLVVNEAMASGLPVLVSNRCGCAMDLVKNGVNGFTFDPHDVEQLAGLMLRIAGTTDYGTTGLRDNKTTRQPGEVATHFTGQGGQPVLRSSGATEGGRSVVRLSEFGDASREIVSHWGPERFAAGLQQAVESALRIPPPRATLLDRLLVKALLAR